MNKQKPRWILVMLLLILAFSTALLGYRGTRSLASLNRASGRVQQLQYQLEGSRDQAVMMRLQLAGAPGPLTFNAGHRTGTATVARLEQREQPLRAARTVTAYYEVDPAARDMFLYQLEADGVVLISLRQSTLANRVGSLVSLVMLLVAAYFGRKQLLFSKPTPRKALPYARRPR